ncbi:GFA family protein [Wenxinia marina]|uniref:CENP-V/GFA domain-containing protein n=1 Tax=Wenxinia marina DSM 24838 TaxID=1123501 RepID=A0A0D0NRU9_9RHOB|nr:GFA family protein [Wenxinia marina]KIQ70970.1 hypothetical protein Wenmar_00346 [Wenxinia marina DSM 24838]GGL55873.1 aldehyde-activating protein [Wenxinia marina]
MIDGACLCGAVRLRADPVMERFSACHCGSCTRWTGGVQFGFGSKADTTMVEGPVRTYRSSPFGERAWCDRCGSALWFREDGKDYEFVPGLFPATHDWPVNNENYVDTGWPAMRLAGEHKLVSKAEYEARAPHVEDAP